MTTKILTVKALRFDPDLTYRAMVNYDSGRVGADWVVAHPGHASRPRDNSGWYRRRGLTAPIEKFSNLLINIRRFESDNDHRQGRNVPFRWYLITLSALFK